MLSFLETAEPGRAAGRVRARPRPCRRPCRCSRASPPEEHDVFRSLVDAARGRERRRRSSHRWDTGREFFVLERGLVDVVRRGRARRDAPRRRVLRRDRARSSGAPASHGRASRRSWRGEGVSLRVLEPGALVRLLGAFPRLEAEIRRHGARRGCARSVSAFAYASQIPRVIGGVLRNRDLRRVQLAFVALQRRRVGRLDRDARVRVRAGRRDDGRSRRARAARARGALRATRRLARRPPSARRASSPPATSPRPPPWAPPRPSCSPTGRRSPRTRSPRSPPPR